MNKRIQELAEQAKEHANSYDDAGTPIWFQFYNEKFALLIVRECAELVKDFYQEDEFTCYSAKTEIKQHFRVEE